MKRIFLIGALLGTGSLASWAQSADLPIKPAALNAATSKPAPAPAAPAANPAAPNPATANPAPDSADAEPDIGNVSQPAQPQGPMVLLMRGLDKITGKPTNIIAPIGKPVQFATLTITARTCYSTPSSETPETTAFVQIDDHRPDQPPRRVFSGWMYASSPGLNGMEHPLYDVWVIHCNSANQAPVMASTAPVKVASPDASDKEAVPVLPAEAGQ